MLSHFWQNSDRPSHLTQFAPGSFSLAPESNLHWPHIRTKTCSICQILWNKLPRWKKFPHQILSYLIISTISYFSLIFPFMDGEWNLSVREGGAHSGLQVFNLWIDFQSRRFQIDLLQPPTSLLPSPSPPTLPPFELPIWPSFHFPHDSHFYQGYISLLVGCDGF